MLLLFTSSVYRTHCSHCDPRIWLYKSFKQMKATMVLRSSLLPYIYSAAYASFRTGALLVHPLYWEFPLEEEAYRRSRSQGAGQQYAFGDAFVVAPITATARNASAVEASIFVPPGLWQEWSHSLDSGGYNGAPFVHSGPMTLTRNYSIDET